MNADDRSQRIEFAHVERICGKIVRYDKVSRTETTSGASAGIPTSFASSGPYQ
ncbi:hypothetical protein [Flaviaesturariibacter amylovorans]